MQRERQRTTEQVLMQEGNIRDGIRRLKKLSDAVFYRIKRIEEISDME